MKILIAEDDAVSRQVLRSLCSKWGHDVVEARDGEEALDILLSHDAPRLAVLDWMMPKTDGVQVCRELRKQSRNNYTYIILLTARSEKEDIVEALESGADDYVRKPFDPQELDARIRAGARIIDLHQELLSTRETLRKQATHDALTGLPNRLLFSERLNRSLTKARRKNKNIGVMFIDLDRFKMVNDTLGHNIGDELLVLVADRLQSCLREADTFARMGGDEFTLILEEVGGHQEAGRIAQRILDTLSAPFLIEGSEFYVSASVGISMFPEDGDDVETLVKNADSAMYRAKENGRNNFQYYTQSLNASALEKMTFENSLRRAISRNELILYYQPQVDMLTGHIMGVEALLRWKHPEFGLVPPGQFIPVAEDTGLILPIGEWVLRTACAQNRAWQIAGYPEIEMAVNMSARQIQQSGLPDLVKRALDETQLEPQYLTIEITESILIDNQEYSINVLEQLKSMGVRVALDDFGTGYSSLSYLKKFPIDAVKIDQSFVRDITADPDDAAIAGAVIAMAHILKLKAIAEGVETLEQLEFLRSMNCDQMQGYFISRPGTAEEIAELLCSEKPHMDVATELDIAA